MTTYALWDSSKGQIPVTLPAPVSGATPIVSAISNSTATTDPGVGNDSTQGYSVGSIWVNTAAGALRFWQCRDSTAGAAKWIFVGADYANGGTTPNIEGAQFGSGSAVATGAGNINRQVIQPAATPGTVGGSLGADYVVAVYTIPASSFDIAGRGIAITAEGTFAPNTNTKRIKLIFNPTTATVGGSIGGGGTTIADTGSVTTSGSGWALQAAVYKYGAAGSNTQKCYHQQAQCAGTVSPLVAPQLATAVESGAILLAVTINNTTALNDAGVDFVEVEAFN